MERDYRPWGYYVVLEDSTRFKVKRIVMDPATKLSYQSHVKRAEDWIIVSGEGIVVLEDVEHKVKKGDHFKIPLGSKHRMINNSTDELIFIEVQTGNYFGEDDITRYNDDYGRVP